VINLIVSLARALNLRVVAEGVETLPQANLLRSLDCHVMQGYLFSRPLTGAQLAQWAREQVGSRMGAGRQLPSMSQVPVGSRVSAGFLF
jgi:EAL domain-containing protein (putative c-di-GMP-specific phosphodiesterase class I)